MPENEHKGEIYSCRPSYEISAELVLHRTGQGWDTDERSKPVEKRTVLITIPRDQLGNIQAWMNALGAAVGTACNSMAYAESERFKPNIAVASKPEAN